MTDVVMGRASVCVSHLTTLPCTVHPFSDRPDTSEPARAFLQRPRNSKLQACPALLAMGRAKTSSTPERHSYPGKSIPVQKPVAAIHHLPLLVPREILDMCFIVLLDASCRPDTSWDL